MSVVQRSSSDSTVTSAKHHTE